MFADLSKGSSKDKTTDKSDKSSDEEEEDEWNKPPNESILLTRITQEKAYWLIQDKASHSKPKPAQTSTKQSKPPSQRQTSDKHQGHPKTPGKKPQTGHQTRGKGGKANKP